MSWLFRAAGGAAVAVVLGVPSPPASHAQEAAGTVAPGAFVDRYCLACHSDSQFERGSVPISLQALDTGHVGDHADHWERVLRRVRSGMMPPPVARQPDDAARADWVDWLETELDRAAEARPPRGRPMTAHRLNRLEYRNAVRDLIGLDVDVEALLPPDDADAEGFDNNAEVLSVSTTLMERYLAAARRISQIAVGDPTATTRTSTYQVPDLEMQDERTSEDLPFGSRGGLAVRHHFPLDGEYLFEVDLRRNFYNYIRGLGNTPHQLDVRLDKALGQDADGRRRVRGRALRDQLLRLRQRRIPGVGQLLGHRGRGPAVPRAGAGRHAAGGAGVRAAAGARRRGAAAAAQPGDVRLQHRRRAGRESRGLRRDHPGPVRRRRAGGDAEPGADLRLPAGPPRGGGGLRGADRARAGAARVPPSRDVQGRDGAAELLRGRPARRRFRDRHPGGARVPADRSGVRLPRRAPVRSGRARDCLPGQRSRARVAALVLPVGEHPGTTSCSTPRRRAGSRSRRYSRRRCAGCWPTPARAACWPRASPGSGSGCTGSATHRRTRRRSPSSTRTCATRCGRRRSSSSRRSCARIARWPSC